MCVQCVCDMMVDVHVCEKIVAVASDQRNMVYRSIDYATCLTL